MSWHRSTCNRLQQVDSDSQRKFGLGTSVDFVHLSRSVSGVLGKKRCNTEPLEYLVLNEGSHLRPRATMDLDRIGVGRERDTMRVSDKPSAIEHVIHLVQCQHDVGFPIANHSSNRVRAGIGGPEGVAVVEVVESAPRKLEQLPRNLLPKRRHEAQIWFPLSRELAGERIGIDATGKNRDAFSYCEMPDEPPFVVAVIVFPEPHTGVDERFLRIIGGDSNHLDAIGQGRSEQLSQDMVAPEETAEHRHSIFTRGHRSG